jgi:3-oxoacyl-[acyl-carrier-protein] synthase II
MIELSNRNVELLLLVRRPKFNLSLFQKNFRYCCGHNKIWFQRPHFATVSACASSTNAIIDAFNYIRLGHADVMWNLRI